MSYNTNKRNIEETCRFRITNSNTPVIQEAKDFGEFCLTDLRTLTVARWNDGNPEPLFDLAAEIEGMAGENEVVIKPAFDTGLGFRSYEAFYPLLNAGVIGNIVRHEKTGELGKCYTVRRINIDEASRYLYQANEDAGEANNAAEIERLKNIYQSLYDENAEAAEEEYMEYFEANFHPDHLDDCSTAEEVKRAISSLVGEIIDDTGSEATAREWLCNAGADEELIACCGL